MKSDYGFLGVLLFGLGATMVFLCFAATQTFDKYSPVRPDLIIPSFIGFIMVGSGLWYIVQSGKPDAKQTPS
jgi:hypothetical protein